MIGRPPNKYRRNTFWTRLCRGWLSWPQAESPTCLGQTRFPKCHNTLVVHVPPHFRCIFRCQFGVGHKANEAVYKTAYTSPGHRANHRTFERRPSSEVEIVSKARLVMPARPLVRRRLLPALDRTFLGLDFAALHSSLRSDKPRNRDAGSVKANCSGTTN